MNIPRPVLARTALEFVWLSYTWAWVNTAHLRIISMLSRIILVFQLKCVSPKLERIYRRRANSKAVFSSDLSRTGMASSGPKVFIQFLRLRFALLWLWGSVEKWVWNRQPPLAKSNRPSRTRGTKRQIWKHCEKWCPSSDCQSPTELGQTNIEQNQGPTMFSGKTTDA